jgi:hypothetical protein
VGAAAESGFAGNRYRVGIDHGISAMNPKPTLETGTMGELIASAV